ncbi:calcium uniporter protein, mitochondrial [Agrilus planipennis]|uniref:Calcium uniporter protein n=1 Tax=Agrilus planipennis TaxID=224129 RepID=A0A7F5QY04_AGRPL|nr:calcium uniporter protein, mitochondrial [Agrilus planipennis]
MAVSGVVSSSRLLLRFEIQKVIHHSSLGNLSLINRCSRVRTLRHCRKFTTSLVSGDKPKEKENENGGANKTLKKQSSSSSSDSDQSDSDDEDVTVEYHRGLPQVTVPLPSRRERCRFTLKPISNTVGDFLQMLKKEDKGIDRAVTLTLDGTRIASSDSIESLLENDFKLVINDHVYHVITPKQDRITSEEVKKLSDVRNLVNQLYEALNVQEHQLQKERDLFVQIETLRQELQPLEEKRSELDVVASRKSNLLAWAGLGLMSIQFGILARLTWWEYSWDIMEPVTYFVTYGTAMAAYAYFVLTKQEYILPEVRDRQHLLALHKKAKKQGLDLTKYNQLKDQITKLERDLRKLRDPLRMHLPAKTKPAEPPPSPLTNATAPTEQKAETVEPKTVAKV